MRVFDMFIKSFNAAWEKEKIKIETKLTKILDHEISCMETSINIAQKNDKDYALELKKKKADLILRKALVAYESEEIAKQRMQLRASYIAVVISAVALLISVLAIAPNKA